MRVISGKAKGRRLKRVPGDTTRPIMDRAKESLFNILGDSVRDTRWLDMFAGTGQVGIEALSRGAYEVVFLDLEMPAIRIIRQNLQTTDLQEGATVLRTDAFGYIQNYRGEPFDLIYIAPPQYKKMWQPPLQTIDKKPERFLDPDGMVIIQIDPKEFEELPLFNLELFQTRKYGKTMFGFYGLSEDDDEEE
jgi:16S rRNA (guanine(966)-N(2))-methyltransferase RsmD